jgi:hypothetical protein
MIRQALILSLLWTIPASSTHPATSPADPDDLGSIVFSVTTASGERPRESTQWLPSDGLGAQHIAGWLISATVYGLCLTTSIPEFFESEPLLTTVRLSRGAMANMGSVTNMRPMAAAIARSVGVVMLSFGDATHGRSSAGVRIALLPIGPGRSGGLSIAGSFSFL